MATLSNLFYMLRPGDRVRVAFGSTGSQEAVVHDITPAGNVRIKKWRVRSKSWTKPVRLNPGDFMQVLQVAA